MFVRGMGKSLSSTLSPSLSNTELNAGLHGSHAFPSQPSVAIVLTLMFLLYLNYFVLFGFFMVLAVDKIALSEFPRGDILRCSSDREVRRPPSWTIGSGDYEDSYPAKGSRAVS